MWFFPFFWKYFKEIILFISSLNSSYFQGTHMSSEAPFSSQSVLHICNNGSLLDHCIDWIQEADTISNLPPSCGLFHRGKTNALLNAWWTGLSDRQNGFWALPWESCDQAYLTNSTMSRELQAFVGCWNHTTLVIGGNIEMHIDHTSGHEDFHLNVLNGKLLSEQITKYINKMNVISKW